MRQVAQTMVPQVAQLEAAVVRATAPRCLGARAKVAHTAYQLMLDGARIDPQEIASVRHRVARMVKDGYASIPRADGPGSPAYPDDTTAASWMRLLGRQIEIQCEELEWLGRMVQAVPMARVETTEAHRLVGAVFTVPHQMSLPGRPLGPMLNWVPTFFGLRPHPVFAGVSGTLDRIGARPLESLGFGALVMWRALAEPEIVGVECITLDDLPLLPHTLVTTEDGGVRLHGAKRRNEALPTG